MSGAALLDSFVAPERIVVIGASRDASAITARPIHYAATVGFPGDVVAVNPGAVPELHGVPAVADLSEVDGGADVAMVMVAQPAVVPALRACVANGIHRAVVIASGFEGNEGAEARADLVELLAAHPELRILGPNCNGALSIAGRVPLTFSSVLQREQPRSGGLSLVMQSGAIGNALFLALIRRGAGLAHLFSTGDELSIGALELATALLDDPTTTAVVLFLEGITDPAHLQPLAEAIERTGKRVVGFRSNASAGARAAAFGHTGRLLGDDELARSAIAAAGVELVDTVEELCDAATILSVVPPAGRRTRPARVGVVTVSGGAGVIAAEAIGRSPGLALPAFGGAGLAALTDSLPKGATVANPLDIPTLGSPEVFNEVLAAAAGAGVDAVVAVATTLAHDYDTLSKLTAPPGVPMVVTHLSPEERFTQEQSERLAASGIATVPSARNAVRALAVWAGPTEGSASPDVVAPSEDAHDHGPLDDGTVSLGYLTSLSLLGDRVTALAAPAAAAPDAEAAIAIADRLGYPVVLKAEGTAVPHRTERGAVAVGLDGPDAVRAAFARVGPASEPDPVIVQAMAGRGVEVFVSVLRDPEVGVAAVLRPGGVLVELGAGSVIITGAPAKWPRALAGSALDRLLAGWRGEPPADRDALLAIVGALIEAMAADPAVMAIECNPVLVHEAGTGATIVDVLVHHDPRRAS